MVRIEIHVGKSYTMLKSSEILSFLTSNIRLSKIEASDLFWEATWPCLLATQQISVAYVLLVLKSPDRVCLRSEGVRIVHVSPTSIYVRTRKTWVDFTKWTERLVWSCFALPIPTPQRVLWAQLKLLESKHNL